PTESMLQAPAVPTPEEFANYYRDQRTALDVAFLPVPTRRFEDAVVGKPSEKELRELYEQGKGRAWSPGSSEPGFKIPRRGKIEYVGADPSSAYSQRLAETSLAATNGLPGPTYRARNGAAAVARLAGPPAVGGGVGPAAAAYAELAVGPAFRDPLS